MSSSVDVQGDGGALAKNYVLTGGALNNGKLKSGVGAGAENAYSLQTPSGKTHLYGVRPMPGITGVDIKEGNDCRDFFKTCNDQFDLIVHLAAIVGGRDTIENDPLAVGTDLSIDAEFFNWAVRTKQSKIIYFSSSAAYQIHFQTKGSTHKLTE